MKRVVCPSCEATLRVGDSALDKRIRCPKCRQSFRPADSSVPPEDIESRPTGDSMVCPACKETLPAGTVFCVHCGFDFQRKRKLKSTFVKTVPKKASKSRPQLVSTGAIQGKIGWDEILRTPFDVEFVLAETAVLTIWAFFWVGFFTAIFGALVVMNLGVFSFMTASAMIAGMLRVWIAAKDVPIKWLLQLIGGLMLASYLLASLIHWNDDIPPGEPSPVFLESVLFFILATLFLLYLRMISFFFGRYFAICKRAAMQTLFGEEDRGGLIDLLYALGLMAVGLVPAIVIYTGAIIYKLIRPADTTINTMFVGLLTAAILWAYFYLPMGVGVVALTRSVDPFRIFAWIGRCLADYLLLILLLLPFHLLVGFLCGAISTALVAVSESLGIPSIILGLVYFFFAYIPLGEYTMVVTLVGLGLVLRRNERRLGWSSVADRV